MHGHITKYTNKILRDRTAVPDSIRFYVLDDRIVTNRDDEWLPVFNEVFNHLNITALLFAKTSLSFADILVGRTDSASKKLVPKDSETKIFLHDIPFIREREWVKKPKAELAAMIVCCLKDRKAVIIQNLGVVATGGLTVEQAFISYSTVFHTTFVKYLLDLLMEGYKLPDERKHFDDFKNSWLKLPDLRDLNFSPGPLEGSAEWASQIEKRERISNEICRVGRYTIEKGYVDSFFGNISYFDGKTIYISQTASSLDELKGHIDPVPLDNSSTAGLSASSELPAHRGIYISSNYHAILHGHPKFSVIMSMFCEEVDCHIEDCNRFCNRRRSVCGIPIVAGETGAGGLAKSVPLAIKGTGVCIAYGHGIFSAGEKDFQEAFTKMAEAEDKCREGYFEILKKNDRRDRGARHL
jgi:ribulose-5-phosphate 4-epimerase/fuculose-1-phosphate aldolase